MKPRLTRKRAGEDAPAPALGLDDEAEAERAIACAACKHLITRASARVEKAGRHHHTCVNPAGFVFHIACFSAAPGAVAHGTPTDAHSWFAGYCWRFASCAGCGKHLGWHFAHEDDFWGLIRAHLIEL
jgi:hypothetical protein